MVECPVCLRDIEIGADAREGDVVQCPHCKIWFRLVREGNEWVAERV
jgi:uncharacterized protein YbaR (Trm112 family)